MRKHAIWMMLGCTLPLLAILLMPLFGISSRWSVPVFTILMFACHLLMLGRHGGSSKTRNQNEPHQH